MKSAGKPSILQTLLHKALKNYQSKKLHLEKSERELFLTNKFAPTYTQNIYRYENQTPIANNTPALEKDIKRNNLYPLFSPKNNTTFTLNFDPRDNNQPHLKKLLAKALPPERIINPQYQKLLNQTEKQKRDLALSPRPTPQRISKNLKRFR